MWALSLPTRYQWNSLVKDYYYKITPKLDITKFQTSSKTLFRPRVGKPQEFLQMNGNNVFNARRNPRGGPRSLALGDGKNMSIT